MRENGSEPDEPVNEQAIMSDAESLYVDTAMKAGEGPNIMMMVLLIARAQKRDPILVQREITMLKVEIQRRMARM